MHKQDFAAFSVLVDNGIFEIYRGSDGKLHIRWILPDPPPDLRAELRAVSAVLNEASRMQNRSAAEKLQQFAEHVLNSSAKELNALVARTEEKALAS
jgi:hypothetical protein